MNKLLSMIAASVLLISFSSFSAALTMDQAKAQGLIGETSNGYLDSVAASPNATVSSLINSINNQRKAAFKTKAAKAGVSLDVMSKRVAQRLFQKAAKGAYLKNPAGKWYKK